MYCVGIYSNGNSGSVLGSNFLRDKTVIFDVTLRKIGIANSRCSSNDLNVLEVYEPLLNVSIIEK